MRSGTEVSDRIKEIDRLIERIDGKFENGEGYDSYEYARDQDKRIELEMERSTLYWVLADF